MKILGKPKNYWGWLRVCALVLFIGVVLWGGVAAVLRLLGEVSWMSWSKYHAFGGKEILEFAILPFLAVIFSTVLEDRNHHYAAYLAREEKLAQEMSAKRVEVMARFEKALETAAPDAARIAEVITGFLPELDEIGKGQALLSLSQKGLLKKGAALSLHGADFREAVLDQVQFPAVCLEGVDLYHAQMSRANLRDGGLSGTNLRRALLCGADLSGADLSACSLHVANLEGANLQAADLTGADLSGAYFRQVNLKGAIIDLEALEGAVVIETILPDGRKNTNQKGVAFLHKKDMEAAINGL